MTETKPAKRDAAPKTARDMDRLVRLMEGIMAAARLGGDVPSATGEARRAAVRARAERALAALKREAAGLKP